MNCDDRHLLTGRDCSVTALHLRDRTPKHEHQADGKKHFADDFCFHISYFLSSFSLLHLRGSPFGGCTNVFLLGKAETAAKTRQVFISRIVRL
jgi:hypothetical protein